MPLHLLPPPDSHTPHTLTHTHTCRQTHIQMEARRSFVTAQKPRHAVPPNQICDGRQRVAACGAISSSPSSSHPTFLVMEGFILGPVQAVPGYDVNGQRLSPAACFFKLISENNQQGWLDAAQR